MSQRMHPTRLLDYGAYSQDITQFPTEKIVVIQQVDAMARVPLSITQKSPVVAQRKKKWFSTTLRVVFTLVLFAVLFKSVSWSLLVQSFIQTRHGMLLVSVIVGFCGIVLSAYQWRSLLHVERITSDLADLINLYIVGVAFSHFLPTGMGGDAIKALYVGRESGNSAGSTSAVLLCRIIGFFGMMLISLPTLLIMHDRLDTKLILLFILLALLVASMIIGALLAVIWLPRFMRGRWAKHRFLSSVINVGNALSKTIKRPRMLLIANLYGLVFWLVAVLNCYCYAEALQLHVPLYFYFFVVPLISLISFLPISINGYGLRETAFVYAFSTVHVASAPALLLALLMDMQALCFAVIGGCIYLTMGEKRKEAKAQKVA